MSDISTVAHLIAGLAAIYIFYCLWRSGRSMDFRLRLAKDEVERSFNFQAVGLFVLGTAIDMGMAPLLSSPFHTAAIIYTSVTGIAVSGSFAARLYRRR